MSLETSLESISKSLAALVQLASAGTTKAETSDVPTPKKSPGRPKKEAPKEDPPADDDGGGDPFDSGDEGGDDAFGDGEGDADESEKALTTEDVRAALTDLQKRTDAATAIEIMKKHGGTNSLSKIPAEKYGAVIDAAKKQTKKLAKS
jgi:hypothetical protein